MIVRSLGAFTSTEYACVVHELINAECNITKVAMVTILLFHEIQISVVEQLLAREFTVIERHRCEQVLVALAKQELPEKHKLLTCEVYVPENNVRGRVCEAGKLEAREQPTSQLARTGHALRIHLEDVLFFILSHG